MQPRSILAGFRRLWARAHAILAMFLLVLPLWEGPLLGPLTRALGGEPVHRCACGMIAGKCGCPECARLEHRRLAERAPSRYATLKSTCNEEEPIGGPSTATPCVLPGALALREHPVVDVFAVPSPPILFSLWADRPPTPPPRG